MPYLGTFSAAAPFNMLVRAPATNAANTATTILELNANAVSVGAISKTAPGIQNTVALSFSKRTNRVVIEVNPPTGGSVTVSFNGQAEQTLSADGIFVFDLA